MNPKRINRINEEIRKVVSTIIQNELKDPRLSGMVSVIEVKTTNDLSFAKIFVTVLGDEQAKANSLQVLENSKGFIRTEIGKRVNLRHVPVPIFQLDESIENSMHLFKLINELNSPDKTGGEDKDGTEV